MAFVIDVYARYIVGWRVAGPPMPTSGWMPWSRRSMIDDLSIAAASFITATAAASMS